MSMNSLLFSHLSRVGLAWKFSCLALLVILSMSIGFYSMVDSTIAGNIFSEHRGKGAAIASNLATNLVEPLMLDNMVKIQLLLKNVEESNEDVVYAFLADAGGNVLSHTFPGGFPGDLKKINIPAENKPYGALLIETEKGRIVDVAVPVLDGSFGFAHIGLSRKDIEEKLNIFRQSFLLISVLFSILAIGVSVYLSRLLTNPLKALVHGAEKIGRGDLEHRVVAVSRDEVGIVAAAFNHMVESLQKDIGRRLQTEKELAAEKERLAVTLRSIGDGVITTDIGGNIVLLNKVAENLTGWSQEGAVGKDLETVFRIINELTRQPCESPFEKVMSTGQIVGLANHTLLIDKNGRERSIADSGAPILDRESNVIGVVLVFRDVTEQARTDKELLKIKKLESVGLLAGGIAHDFNNLLVAILGNIDMSLLDNTLTEGTRKYLQDAEKASMRARNLTQQLLTFARGGEPVKETTSLAEIVEDSANFVLSGLPVTCRYDIPDTLWLVEIDKGQISQVVQNIVINAGHSMPGGGVIEINCENLDVSLSPQVGIPQDGKFVKMTIMDHGRGMEADVLEKIFDPYFSTKEEGSGLGLAITHSIIKKHDGYIFVESEPGKGTIFSLFLPVAKEQTIVNVHVAPPHERSSTRGTIMVMDDEEMVRQVAEAMFQQMGHDVMLARDGDEALQLYEEAIASGKTPDLVVMDLTIPGGMGGREAVSRLLELDPSARVAVSSGYSNDPVMADFEKYGFVAAIVKPYQMSELERVLRQFSL